MNLSYSVNESSIEKIRVVAEFDGFTAFMKSGPRRLRDAEKLLSTPTVAPNEQGADTRHLRGAMYLAGYSVKGMLNGAAEL